MLSSPRSSSSAGVAAFPAGSEAGADQWVMVDADTSLFSPVASSASSSSQSAAPAVLSRPASFASIPSGSSSSSSLASLPSASLSVAELERLLAEAKLVNASLLEDNHRLAGEVSTLKARVVEVESALTTIPKAGVVGEEQAGAADAELAALKLQHVADQGRINDLQALILRIENGRVAGGGVPHSRRALARLLHATRRSAHEAPVSSRVARRGLKGAAIASVPAQHHRAQHFAPRVQARTASATR